MKERQTWEEQLKVTEDIIRYFEWIERHERKLERKLKELEEIEEIEERLKKSYDILPNSAPAKVIKDLLQKGERIKENEKITMSPLNLMTGEQEITYKSHSTELQITIEDMNKIGLKQDENARKLFNFLLTKANEQGKQEYTYFELNELVERGIYKTEDSAYKGMGKFLDRLRQIDITGIQWSGYGLKKKEISCEKAPVVVRRKVSRKGKSFFKMEQDILKFLCSYYGLFPKWAVKLSNKAYTAFDHFYYIANQNKESITKSGIFTLSYENIRLTLNLPDPKKDFRHKERIIQVIENALDEIEMSQNVNSDLRMYFIRIEPDNYLHISQYLAQNLEIIIDDGTQEYIKKRNTIKQNKTRKTRQSRERAEHQAIVKAITKKIESGEKIFNEKADV